MKKKAFDAFISHASEDKEAFVEPLAVELRKRGLNVWFDKFELKVGSSLRESIERGLATSNFGIVVFSPNFFKKKWPQAELNGLFAREISGNKKRILPVLHNTSIGELRKRYPIQADKISLSSDMPTKDLCDAFIRVIRPELLRLEILQKRSFDASSTFVEAAKAQYPGYEFSVHTNKPPEGDLRYEKPDGKNVVMRIVDPSVMKCPPTVNVTFVGQGAVKAEEFLRTGKPQTWTAGEFIDLKANVPFFPTTTPKGSILSVGPVMDSNPRPVRIEIGETPQVTLGLMTMKVSRRGLEEGELEIQADSEPLSLAIAASFTESKEFGVSLSWRFSGFSAQRCQRAIDAVDLIRGGSLIRIIDLKEERPTIELPTIKDRDEADPFGKQSRRFYSLCSQIEKYFNVQLTMSMEITEEVAQNLTILDCLLNGKDFKQNISLQYQLVKGTDALLKQQLLILQGEEFNLSSEVQNYVGYFEIFGCKITTPSWGISARWALDATEAEKLAFLEAEEGFILPCNATLRGPIKLVWMNEGQQALLSR